MVVEAAVTAVTVQVCFAAAALSHTIAWRLGVLLQCCLKSVVVPLLT